MKSLFSFFLLIFIINTNQAQYNSCERWSFGANFTLSNPIDDMEDNGFRTNYGVTFNGLYNLNPDASNINFHIGARITGGVGIGERDNIILEDPAGVSARNSVYNTLVDMHILGRAIIRPDQKVQAYFDFFGGGRLLGANNDIRLNRRVSNYDRKTSERIVQSSNWAWGTGAGVLIHLKDNAYFDLGLNYTQSESQEFVDMNTVSVNNDIVQYDLVNSVSNSVGIHIGFHFLIDCNQQVDRRDDHRTRRNNSRFKRNKKTPKAKKSGGKN